MAWTKATDADLSHLKGTPFRDSRFVLFSIVSIIVSKLCNHSSFRLGLLSEKELAPCHYCIHLLQVQCSALPG